ncbi:hypothetical protein ABZ923_36935 [Streptomyces sp. NPDC046881]|uniref:hypothetical protein n=1 Tax=Streptomyces sp. NPDC046881 TaxID=3155374 RepID=UPI00340DADA6
MWLIDSEQVSTHATTGSDWCLIVERSAPGAGYDMAESGRVEAAAIHGETPFADYLGETIPAVDDERDPYTGRIALEITGADGARPSAPGAARTVRRDARLTLWAPSSCTASRESASHLAFSAACSGRHLSDDASRGVRGDSGACGQGRLTSGS